MKLFGWVGLGAALAAGGQATAAGPPTPAGMVGAKAYVDWIYRSLPNDDFDDADGVRYAPELRRWLERDRAWSARTGYVGAIDAVPFCDCQDTTDNYRFESRVVKTAAGATAHVRLRNGGWQVFRIDLIASPRGWLVADVHSKDMPSLLAHLRREVPREEKDR